ncbi:GGDEF domain-containing protein [Halopseudomonas salegens]|uniref:Diguanylate cyclase with PAS/PAC and GAF sensors n=1 Tax=Halopseudomonas salegens TaxID=1434072 RepID=A0A1H2HYS2_9GAMM|nr:GGDEF domain-containing protein [Halopseudomonas salegens]SDU36698.1 diguanylate cyclase with PAS/PAC and GAF sensors [Halopseudomonas salegens]
MTSNAYLPHDKLIDRLLDVVCVVDKDARFLYVSAASERVFGYRPEEMLGRTTFELMHPDDRAATQAIIAGINAGRPNTDHENRYIRKDGSVVHIMWSTQWLEAEQVRVGVARDITERKQAEAVQAALYAISEAAHSAHDLPALYQLVRGVIGRLLPADNFLVALYDATNDQLSFPYFIDQYDTAPGPMPLASAALTAEVIRSGEALLLTPETAGAVLDRIGPVMGKHALDWLGVPLVSDNVTIGALVLQSYSETVRYSERDKELLQFVSNQVAAAIGRQRAHSRLEFLAQYDQLTELPNRAMYLNRLQTALRRAQQDALQLAVIYLDLDNFKQINDTFGHAIGDQLLCEVGLRLRQCVRESDTIGRLGGDEFAILLDGISKQDAAIMVAEKILVALSAPYLLAGETLNTAPSLGIALFPDHGQDDIQLVQHADEAMYVAKRSGGRGFFLATNAFGQAATGE